MDELSKIIQELEVKPSLFDKMIAAKFVLHQIVDWPSYSDLGEEELKLTLARDIAREFRRRFLPHVEKRRMNDIADTLIEEWLDDARPDHGFLVETLPDLPTLMIMKDWGYAGECRERPPAFLQKETSVAAVPK